VQSEAIPFIRAGRDVIAASPTGTGKTLAYLLPIYEKLDQSPELVKRLQVLILVPTYELAAQVYDVACRLPGKKPVLLVGSAGIGRQIEAMKDKPQVVIGSLGRVVELIKMKKLTAHFIKTVVLDECDKLVDKNSIDHLSFILKAIPRDRQVLLFSATAKENVEILNNFLIEPLYIDCKGLLQNIIHRVETCERRDKHAVIRRILHQEKITKTLLFVKNAGDAEQAAEKLNHHNFKAAALSANMTGIERKTAINRLRNGDIAVLSATDAAARGLDIHGLTHVINMEPPMSADEYLHRAGRTGRMGADGTVITLVSAGERVRLDKIAKALRITLNIYGG